MKLNSLRLTNFRQHVSTDISFGSGITGIIGPNGAGKTTILEAVAFALYAWGRSNRDLMLSLAATGRPKPRLIIRSGPSEKKPAARASLPLRRRGQR